MSSVPILSKKQQNKTIASKKKATKTIKNVLSFAPAVHWPLLSTESDKSSILNILQSIKKVSIDKNSRAFLKFGINEIVKSIKADDCSAIFIDGDVPRILVMHLVSMAISKSIPLLCIQGLKDVLKKGVGFKTSSLGLTKSIKAQLFCTLSDRALKLCKQNFKQIYEVDDSVSKADINEVENKITIMEVKDKVSSSDKIKSSSLDFIKFDEGDMILDVSLGIRKSKRKCTFQPLLIKRVRMNPDRCGKTPDLHLPKDGQNSRNEEKT